MSYMRAALDMVHTLIGPYFLFVDENDPVFFLILPECTRIFLLHGRTFAALLSPSPTGHKR